MDSSTTITVISTPPPSGGWVDPDYDARVTAGAARVVDEVEARAQERAADNHERSVRRFLAEDAEGLPEEVRVVTITAGDFVKGVPMSPQRADLLEATVRSLFREVFTGGWLAEGHYTHAAGTRVDERSLVVVGVVDFPDRVLKDLLRSIGRQFGQESLGLMVAHGGGEDSLVWS
jgi:hypothetical protein